MAFTEKTKREALGRQIGRCGLCGYNLQRGDRAYDFHHIHPQATGGSDTLDNCVMLCYECHNDEAHVDGNMRSYVLARSEYRYLNG